MTDCTRKASHNGAVQPCRLRGSGRADPVVLLSILMPCRDEAAAVGQCVDDARAFLDRKNLNGEIVVVDNGSVDGSADVAASHGARVIFESRPGYGAALRKGLKECLGRVIIFGDCDTTYDFTRLDEIYALLSSGAFDVVIGDRFAGGVERGAMPLSHRVGVRMLSVLGRLKTGTEIRDFHCGLRGLTREAACSLDFRTEGMEFASEMIALAAKRGLRIGQVPVLLRRCEKKRKSKLRAIPDGLRHLRYLLFR